MVAIRQRGSLRRVGPTASDTGADTASAAERRTDASDAAVTCGWSTRTGRTTGCRSNEPRELASERPGRSLVEHPSRLTGNDAELEPVPDELRVAVGGVDRLRHEPELVGNSRRGGAGGGRRLGREEAQLEPAEAADEAEPVATARGLVDRLRPVDPDTELGGRQRVAVAARGELHRNPRDLLPPPFERRARLGAAHPADVDPVHARARRERVRRARIEQAEAQRRQNGEQAQPRHTDAEPLARCGPAARANCRGGCGHGRRILAIVGRDTWEENLRFFSGKRTYGSLPTAHPSLARGVAIRPARLPAGEAGLRRRPARLSTGSGQKTNSSTPPETLSSIPVM